MQIYRFYIDIEVPDGEKLEDSSSALAIYGAIRENVRPENWDIFHHVNKPDNKPDATETISHSETQKY
jgi:hypothetical protein